MCVCSERLLRLFEEKERERERASLLFAVFLFLNKRATNSLSWERGCLIREVRWVSKKFEHVRLAVYGLLFVGWKRCFIG